MKTNSIHRKVTFNKYIKRVALPILLILFFAQSTYAQCKEYTITIDYKKKSIDLTEFDDIDKIERGDFYQIVINNIDLRKYKVEVNGKDSTVINQLDLSPLFGLDVSKITDLLSSVNTFGESVRFKQSHDNPFGFQQVEAKYEAGNTMRGTKGSQQNTKCDSHVKALFLEENHIIDSKIRLFNFVGTLNRRFDELTEYFIYPEGVCGEEKWDSCKVRKEFEETIDMLRDSIEIIQKGIYDHYKEFNDELGNTKIPCSSNETINKFQNHVRAGFDSLTKAVFILSEQFNRTHLDSIRKKISDSRFYSLKKYKSLPMRFTKDVSSASIRISEIAGDQVVSTEEVEYMFPTSGRRYIAIGTGLYLSGLRDEAYSILGKQVPDSSVIGYSLIEEEVAAGEFGASILLRYGWKLGKERKFGLHLSAGTGFSFTKQVRPRLLFGGGASFGDKHRFTADLGLITGYTNRLSNAFAVGEDNEYIVKPTDFLVSKTQHSGFISLGYLFTF